jgi:CelD/BcsL family acetyltransferase involved in cellulose biosynthesis
MIEVVLIKDSNEFRNLRDEWNELLSRSKANTFFLTWEWLWCWWDVYKDNKELNILVARENDKLVGCVPLYLSKKNFYGISKIRRLEFLGTGRVCSDYLDFILYPEKEAEILKVFLDYLENDYSKNWDILNLSDIPESSPTIKLLSRLSKKKEYLFKIVNSTTCLYITLPNDFQSFLNSLSKKFRKEIEYDRRRLARLGEVELYQVSKEEELPDAMDQFIKFHQDRWMSAGGMGHFHSKNYTIFHKKVATELLKKNWLKLVFLKVNKKPVGCRYYFTYDNKVFSYQSGYDTSWSKYSIGLVLYSYCIEDAISKGITEYNLLRGTIPIKYRFKPHERKNIEIEITKQTIKVKLYYLGIRSVNLAKGSAKKIIGEKHWFKLRNLKDRYKARVDHN